MAPDSLGGRTHRDICIRHDLDYWFRRTLIDKIVADAKWSYRIIKRHWTNTPWQPVAILFAIIGWLGVSTVGSWMWKYRHRWDTPLSKT